MLRMLPICTALLWCSLVGRGEAQPTPTETIVRLTVQPAAEPKPALRYQLLPELSEMQPGNPIQDYLKCFMEQNPFFFGKEVVESRQKLLEMPLKELPVKELRHYGGIALRRADYAARLQTPDWQALVLLRRDGFGLLVPELQVLRGLSQGLHVRMRGEIADRRFHDAMVTAKTRFALSRHVGEHPSLIGTLMAVLFAYTTVQSLEEMIGQPGCPNLYWALTALPNPLIDLHTGLQGWRLAAAVQFRDLRDDASMTEPQLETAITRAQELHAHTFAPKQPEFDVRSWLFERARDAAKVAAARKRLIDHGLSADKVKQFPAVQVILLDEKRLYEVSRDAAERLVYLPLWQAERIRAEHRDAMPGWECKVFGDATPIYRKVHFAQQARLEQRISLLRCVEAIRIYAAAHNGKLPAALAEVPVPLPVDPVTGKAFMYSLQGGTATLRGSPPAGFEKSAAHNVRYEITIAAAR